MTKKTLKFDFEKKIADLEKIIMDMEQGEISLDESLKNYEAGINLIRQCHKYLKEAEQKVQILKQSTPEDKLEDYELDEGELKEEGACEEEE